MPKTHQQIERDQLKKDNDFLKSTLRDTELTLFDSVIELALRNLSMLAVGKDGRTTYPHKFACDELLHNRGILITGRNKNSRAR